MSKSEKSYFLLRHFILFKEKYDDLKKSVIINYYIKWTNNRT